MVKRDRVLTTKNVLSFILTVLAIFAVLFGTCILNAVIVEKMRAESFVEFLVVAWLLFPIILFGHVSRQTQNKGMKWAVIVFSIVVAWWAWVLFFVCKWLKQRFKKRKAERISSHVRK